MLGYASVFTMFHRDHKKLIGDSCPGGWEFDNHTNDEVGY